MVEDGKKISFSFSKVTAKPKVIPNVIKPAPEKAVQFIECVEKNSIKVIGITEDNNEPLVIPMQPSAKRSLPTKRVPSKENGSASELRQNGSLTLEEMAVRELLSGKKENDDQVEVKVMEVPMIVNPPDGKEESTAEDYSNVPIQDFGLAMLRGMGWKADKGIGKNAQLIAASMPELRPKGMGLGADKVVKSAQKTKDTNEELKLANGSYVQFDCGRLDGQYGQVMGFDEGAARVMVKMARTGQMEKVGENTFSLVTKSDYDKNSKVLNIKEYKDYHAKKDKMDDVLHRYVERKNKIESIPQSRDKINDRSENGSNGRSRHHKTKKSKHSKSPHRKHKSDHKKHKKNKHKRSSS
ncbi:G-patch domain and KOW motifs-containing protein [Adelges cooleyi]|uniref:G-patch domain and KOW motifs-containing protein n=1 Tax=Adelges cooleyi TaxID=133065 RepID=UPI00217F96C2|nr:G-patch domain and KOW motifs-containing protein [Adelges cooleyi]